MTESKMRPVGSTIVYRCDACGVAANSKPIPPPPALDIYGLPAGWALGLEDRPDGRSSVLCGACAVQPTKKRGTRR